MTIRRLYQVDAFTRERFAGNPAGVVANADGLSDSEMQSIARELNNSETAFILAALDSSHDFHTRFFTPTTEVPVCATRRLPSITCAPSRAAPLAGHGKKLPQGY